MNIQPGDVPNINENDLKKPPAGLYEKDSVIRKYYNGFEVACKPIEDSSQNKVELAILGKLSLLSPNILKFYSLSYFDNNEYMIFEWAERGNLKELYKKYDIPWNRKIQIIHDICNGLIFLRGINILHHDIRCKNVFITKNLDPKLGNFQYARETNASTTSFSIQNQLEMFRWMAPKQIKKYKKYSNKKSYTFSCEMFSFRMLIWELCYERIPYKPLETEKVADYVLSGKREKLTSRKFDNANDVNIQKKFNEIINKGNRIDLMQLHSKLEKLAEHNPIALCALQLLENNKLDFAVANAQYRYAVSLINNFGNNPNINDEKRNEILHYLKLASNNKNNKVAYQLGNIYMNGALKTQQNKELGLIYLELASQY
ncbi:16155_t:CDS:2, partial [Gigaspora margarita]